MLAHQFVGKAHIIEVVHFDHQVVDALFQPADPESHRMVAVVAMHERGRNHVLAHANLVFDTAAHSQKTIKAIRSRNIILTYDAMSYAAGSGLEPSVHPPAWMEGLAELHLRAVEDLEGIPARIVEFK